jgi:hypothetical protein
MAVNPGPRKKRTKIFCEDLREKLSEGFKRSETREGMEDKK